MSVTNRVFLVFLLLNALVGTAVAGGVKTTVASGPPTEQSLVPPSVGAVVLDHKTLFLIKGKVLSFTAEERAQAISERLARLAVDTGKTPVIVAVDGEAATDIIADDRIIMSVTNADADTAGVARQKLAEEYADAVRSALSTYQSERSADSLLFASIYALTAIIVFSLVLWLLSRLFRWLLARLEAERGRRIRTIRFQSIEILNEERIVSLLHTTFKIVKIILYLVLFDIFLTTILGLFPWTRNLAELLTGYVLAPLHLAGQAFVNFLPNAFFIVVIIALTYVALRLTRFLFDEVGKGTIRLPNFHSEWAAPTFNIVRFLVIAFAVVVAFPYLPGADSPAFKGVSVFLGVLLSFGSTSAVGNIVSGVIITYMRPFKIGDRVRIAETVGDVVEKTLLITRVRTIKNVDITIPNAMVLGSHITNFSSSAQEYGLILPTTVTIGYDAPWRQVHELLIAAAISTEHILTIPAPFVLQTSLDDFYVRYELNAYTDKPAVMAMTFSLLHQNIQDKFNAAGVEIMSPHYSSLRDGNTMAIPADYLPAEYQPPAHRISTAGTGKREEVAP